MIVEEAIPPPGFTPKLTPDLLEFLSTVPTPIPSSEEAITTYSYGPETAGSKIALPDGTIIQLPDDAYIHSSPSSVSCWPGDGTPCPILPLYDIARGDAIITVEGNGVVSFWKDERRGSSSPQDFDFLKHLITDPDELWKTNTDDLETATSTPGLPEGGTENNASTH